MTDNLTITNEAEAEDARTQTSLNAAKLLGLTVYTWKGRVCRSMEPRAGACKRVYLDIFADTPKGAWDREQVVKVLGEKYRIDIYWRGVWRYSKPDGSNADRPTYQEAIGAAVNAVSRWRRMRRYAIWLHVYVPQKSCYRLTRSAYSLCRRP